MIKTRLLGLVSKAKKYVIYNIMWQWLALLSQIAVVFTAVRLLERVWTGSADARSAAGSAAVLLLAAAARFVCERMAARASYLASADVKRILRSGIYEKLLRLGASYHERTATSEALQLSTEGVEQLETYFGK